MSKTFRGYQITKDDEGQKVALTTLSESDLMEGDVTVQVEYSTVNYKDGLALTGKAPVVRRFPLTPGIDFAGTVTGSDNADFKIGDKVVLNGWGVGEVHSGGFAEIARVKGDWLVPLPDGISTRQAMAVGTAGYTSMLCVLALQNHGLNPETDTILVTGAAGGVGSVAVLLLSNLGYKVVAVTGRMNEADFLHGLGASEIIDRQQFSEKAKPLGRELWAGAVDVAGGNTLANVISQMKYGGAVAACGLADSLALPGSVAPFILRGVTLYGIDSVMAPMAKRMKAWQHLVSDLDFNKLDTLCTEIPLEDIPTAAENIMAGKVRGRTIVKVR
ncbi:MDR family oxidoreductase [Desulfosediminicola flagellatus]|uniref:acrylyl-CoA reductase (NADPH) n=1 Tax=Desulfosediminicola flagellatus TaxID=2569541 RepID=UPI0010ACB1CC|nr:MDR family oxidoreductase [Desulfosediminicola flagellatus]